MKTLIALLAFSMTSLVSTTNTTNIYQSGGEYERYDGYMWNFSGFDNNVVLIHVWESTSVNIDVKQEMYDLEASLRSPEFRVVHVSIDDDKAAWQSYVVDNDWIGTNHIYAPTDMNDPLAQIIYQPVTDGSGNTTYEANPNTFFMIDRDGIGHFIQTGWDSAAISDAILTEL